MLYFADLKDITGKDKEIYEINEGTIQSLIHLLFEKYSLIKNLIWEEKTKTIKKSIRVAINDKLIKQNDISLIILNERDRVAFLLPISGG